MAPNRGRRGATMINTPIARQQGANRPALITFRSCTSWPARENTYQIEPRSPPRSELKVQKLRQASGASTRTGRLTAAQLRRAAQSVVTKSGIRRPRRQSRNSGPSSSPG